MKAETAQIGEKDGEMLASVLLLGPSCLAMDVDVEW